MRETRGWKFMKIWGGLKKVLHYGCDVSGFFHVIGRVVPLGNQKQ